MSADSLRKQSKQGYHGQVILPQPINDPSLIESVAGFIHEVVPQAYSSVLPCDSKDGILWARFDSIDYNDPENFPQFSECESDTTPPLLLVLGYSTGVQVWSVCGSGEATELLSWCQGAVKALRFLLKPHSRDSYASKRPLVAIVDSSSPGPQFSTLSFVSLRTAEVVKIIKFHWHICDVHCNRKSIVVTFSERIAVFDSATLEDRLTITTCYPSPGNSPNPVALGTRWLAYGEKRLTTWQRSSGGCEGDGAQSYTSAVIHAAKSLGKGLRELGGSLTGSSTQSSHNGQAQPGVVSIVDIERKSSISEEDRGNMIAHFVAHTSAVVAMAFDPSGLLLVTADRHGHRFNVFRIHPHPCTSQLAAVHHLYILHRGETTAKVQDIAISWDSRWVAVSSVRGTTHVFPITPYGGLVTVRTHTTAHVVNKLSRFERSAGLRDGRGSPLPCEAPTTPPPPRLPPYPHPSLINPLAQLRARPDDAPLAAFFGPPRAWLPGRPKAKRTCADSLYVICSSGAFMQYDLDPKVIQGVPKEKISFDTPIELGIEAKAEWILPKPPYTSSLCPPLPLGHVLLDLPPRSHPPPDKWLSQVEIVTHTGPHRRLWMGPQFTFKSIDPLPQSGGESECGNESGNPLRSNPVNMPHRPYLLVEIGSGSPQMSEGDEAGGRLREDLADAMLETHNSSGQAKGKLRKAEMEWQVNPLGAVQTHPAAPHLQWPHPIFFEPYSPEHYWGLPSSQKSVEGAEEGPQHHGKTLESSVKGLELKVESNTTLFEEKDFDSKGDSEVSQFTDISHLREASFIPIDSDHLVNANLSKILKEPLDNKDCLTPLTSVSHLGEIDISCMPSEVPLRSCSPSQDPITTSVSSSRNPGIEDKVSKQSGKKSRKRKNGNDKKSKKDQTKPSVEESILVPPLIESVSLIESVLSGENDSKIAVETKEKQCTVSHSIESSSPILACGLVEVSSFTADQNIKDFHTTKQIVADREYDGGFEELNTTLKVAANNESDDILSVTVVTDSLISRSAMEEANILHNEVIISNEKDNEASDPKTQISDQSVLISSSSDKTTESLMEIGGLNNVVFDHSYICIPNSMDGNEKDLNGNDTLNESLQVDSSGPLSSEIPASENLIDFGTSEVVLEHDKNIDMKAAFDVNPEDDTKDSDIFSVTHITDDLECSETSIKDSENKPLYSSEGESNLSTNNEFDVAQEANKDVSVMASDVAEVSNEESDKLCIIAETSEVTKIPEVASEILTEMDFKDEQCYEFVTVSSKSSRNKNRRRKKDKKQPEIIQSEHKEFEPIDSNLNKPDGMEVVEIGQSQDPHSKTEKIKDSTIPLQFSKITSSIQRSEDKKVVDKIESPSAKSATTSLRLSEIHSDQVVSTDKSEIEDVSSHSGKESDDSKINKKERSRKQRRSESSDKDRSSLKNKSCSPSTTLSEKKDSDSSDEAEKSLENKTRTPKIPKRNKGKKNDELISEKPVSIPDRNSPSNIHIKKSLCASKSEAVCSSSNTTESSSESKVIRHKVTRSWSHSASSSDHQCSIDDRDSVYESCNDDGTSDSIAFESSKEDFDDVSAKVNTSTEPSSSNTEEKTDTCDKINQPLKRVRKQKKKKR